MKKRKELDALLMNGKKSRTKRSKDGHELLQNMDSDSNSSDLDEFIMQPRKHTIVRRKIDLCSVCLHLLAFILVVTCISICIGVVWMNFQLKNDLDKLTQKVADVESSLSRSQGSPLDKNQEEALKKIPSLVTNIGLLNDSLNTLNKSVGTLKVNLTKLEAKVEQFTAFMAEKEADFKSLQQKLENLETSVDNLKTDIATLKEKPSQEPTQSPSKVTSPAGTRTEPLSDTSGALLSVRQSLQTLNDSVSKLNQTVLELAAEVSKQHDDTIPAGDSTEELLQKLQQNVTYLMEVVQKELSADDDSTDAPSGTSSGGGTIPPAANITSWQHLMENRIGTLEIEFKQFNPSDLNNNLLNNDTARGIQTILENTNKVFREEIHNEIKAWASNQTDLANRISEQSLLIANLTVRVDHVEFQFQNTSTDKVLEGAKDDDSVGITPVLLQELTSEPPKIQSVDTGITSPSVENEVTTSAHSTASTNSSIKTGEAVKTTKPSQEGISTLVQAVTTESGEGASIGTVADLENLKHTLPSSLGGRSMASRSVASLTDVTEFITGVEEVVSTNIGSTLKSTEHITTTGKKLTTTPLPPLRIPGITSLRVFQKQFRKWDANRDEKLDYGEFSQLRGFEGHPPPEDQFLAHDTDGDGTLNQHEMAVALGFRHR